MNNIKNKILRFETVEWIIIVLAIYFLFWRCKYGWCFNDEPLFVAFAERLFNGQVLYADEWHVAQNTGIVLLPFYSLFRLFSSNNDGVLLCFRYIYCFLWVLTCLYVYKTFRKESKFAIAVFIFLMLFQPLDYPTLSYTSISLMCSLCICCVLYTLNDDVVENSKFKRLGFSLLWIVLVLCIPLMAAAYVIFIVVSNIIYKYKKTTYVLNIRNYANSTITVCLLAALIYVTVIYFNSTTQQLIDCFKSTATSHPHLMLRQITDILYLAFCEAPVLCVMCLVTCVIGFFFHKEKNIVYISFATCCILCIYYIFKNSSNVTINTEVLYIGMLGFTSFFVTKNIMSKKFIIFYSYTFLYCLLQACLSSNTNILAFSMDLCVGTTVGIIEIITIGNILLDRNDNKKNVYRCLAILCYSIILLQLCFQLHVKFNRQYWDSKFITLNTRITEGAAKGLYTNKDRAQEYETNIKAMNELFKENNITKENTFLCLTRGPVWYLDSNLKYNTFSAWHCNYDNQKFNNALTTYYKDHNDVYPDVIISFNDDDIIPIIDGYRNIKKNGTNIFIK